MPSKPRAGLGGVARTVVVPPPPPPPPPVPPPVPPPLASAGLAIVVAAAIAPAVTVTSLLLLMCWVPPRIAGSRRADRRVAVIAVRAYQSQYDLGRSTSGPQPE